MANREPLNRKTKRADRVGTGDFHEKAVKWNVIGTWFY